jgi:hypothetical protein
VKVTHSTAPQQEWFDPKMSENCKSFVAETPRLVGRTGVSIISYDEWQPRVSRFRAKSSGARSAYLRAIGTVQTKVSQLIDNSPFAMAIAKFSCGVPTALTFIGMCTISCEPS